MHGPARARRTAMAARPAGRRRDKKRTKGSREKREAGEAAEGMEGGTGMGTGRRGAAPGSKRRARANSTRSNMAATKRLTERREPSTGGRGGGWERGVVRNAHAQ